MIPKQAEYQCPVCRKICYDHAQREFAWMWHPCDQMLGVAVTLCPRCEKAAAEESRKPKAENPQPE